MPMQFRTMYEGLLENWMRRKSEDLGCSVSARDYVTGEEVDVSVTGFTDDVKELNLAVDAQEAVENVCRSTVLLDEDSSAASMGQNAGKAEHVATFLGPGQDSFTRKFKEEVDRYEVGALRKEARYLGAWPTFNGSPAEVVDKRCKAAKEAYYSMGKAWRRGVSLKLKSQVFKGLVVSTLLSGLEAEALRGCDYEKLDKVMMRLARRVCVARRESRRWRESRGSVVTRKFDARWNSRMSTMSFA